MATATLAFVFSKFVPSLIHPVTGMVKKENKWCSSSDPEVARLRTRIPVGDTHMLDVARKTALRIATVRGFRLNPDSVEKPNLYPSKKFPGQVNVEFAVAGVKPEEWEAIDE